MNKLLPTSILALALTLFCFCATAQSIVYVSPGGAGAQNGSSWSNAYSGTRLREVLRQSPELTQVWVAAGTYKPHNTSRDSSFFIRSNLKVYGGFAGNETTLSQRNWTSNVTVLSGNIGNLNDSLDNSYHVVYFENARDSTVLDGFTITDGSALRGPYDPLDIRALGAGILNRAFVPIGGTGLERSAPTIQNCIIRNNHGMRGSGLCEYGTARIFTKVINCSFEHNTATDQGGAYALEASTMLSLSDIRFNDCKFISNKIDTTVFYLSHRLTGGAVSLIKGNLKIINSSFEYNEAPSAAVLNAVSGTSILFDGCLVKNNVVYRGALIYCMTSAAFRKSVFEQNPTGPLSNILIDIQCTFGNRTKNEISNCIFRNNFLQPSLYGAYALRIRAAALSISRDTAIDTTYITNCLFYHTQKTNCINTGAGPGGRSNTYITNTTFYTDIFGLYKGQVNNAATSQAGDPNGPSVANLTVTNSILYYPPNSTFDTALSYSIVQETQGPSSTANTMVRHSLIRSKNNSWPADAGTNGGGNIINGSPRFMDTLNKNFRLACNSAAINAGNASYLPAQFTTDLDGNQRIYGPAIDMGCYEHSNPTFNIIPSISKNGLTIHYDMAGNIALDSVRWDFGDNSPASRISGNHTYGSYGTKRICAKVFTACGTKDTCFNINLCSDPIAGFSYSGSAQRNVSFTYTGQAATNVSWDFGDGSTATGNTVTHQYASATPHQVCVTATRASCENTFCKIIISDSTGNGTQVTGVNNTGAITLYPNPASHTIQFSGTAAILSADIYHSTGQLVQHHLFHSNDNSRSGIDIGGLAPGIYFVKTTSANNQIQVFKLLKQ